LRHAADAEIPMSHVCPFLGAREGKGNAAEILRAGN
jgi:hypothetical protein